MEETYRYDSALDLSALYPLFAFFFALVLIGLIAHWRIFTKAGKPGWASLIPFYNIYVSLKIVGKPGWWMLMLFIPFVNIYFGIKTTHLLSQSFGKGVGFTLGLLFLPFLFYPVLAFGSAVYLGPYGDPETFTAMQNASQFEFENEVR